MQTPGTISDSRASQNRSPALPLFRQEALLYQQQKFYGEIILIRPLSLTLLTWLVTALAAGTIALLGFGHYTEKARLPVSLVSRISGNQVELRVPVRWIGLVHPGAHLAVRCRRCSPPGAETATVVAVSTSAPRATDKEITATLSFSPSSVQALQINHPQQGDAVLEAELPLGRKPLIEWFFSRPAN